MLRARIKTLKNKIYNRALLRRRAAEYANDLRILGRLSLTGGGRVTIGSGVTINSSYGANPTGINSRTSLYVLPGATLSIGDGVGMSNCVIAAARSVSIGNNVMIGTDVKIYDTDFHSSDFDERMENDRAKIPCAPVEIADGAFIGSGAIILKGVRVGRRSVVGAGSVVTRDVPDGEVWAGNPAKFIKKLD